MGLIEPFEPDDDYRARDAKRRMYRNAKSQLIAADWIAQDANRIVDLALHK
jgi:hypothetical protein